MTSTNCQSQSGSALAWISLKIGTGMRGNIVAQYSCKARACAGQRAGCVIWYAHLVQQYLDEELANPYRLRAAGILPAIAPHNDQRLVAKVRQKPMLSFAHRLRRMLERYERSEEIKHLEARRCGLQGKKTYRSHRSFGTLVKRRYKNATPRTYIGAYGFSISDNCSSVNLTPHSCYFHLGRAWKHWRKRTRRVAPHHTSFEHEAPCR